MLYGYTYCDHNWSRQNYSIFRSSSLLLRSIGQKLLRESYSANMAELPEMLTKKHIDYILALGAKTETFEYYVTEHLRMSGVSNPRKRSRTTQ